MSRKSKAEEQKDKEKPDTKLKKQKPKKKTVNKKKKNKGGRPRKIINYRTLNSLCKIQCTGEECAAILGIDYDTLNNTLKKEKSKSFKEYFAEKGAYGKRSLRRKQWSVAMKGDRTMLIWLGKQHLGQAEKHELTGKDGGPIEQRQIPALDLSSLSDDELALAEKLGLGLKKNGTGSNPG